MTSYSVADAKNNLSELIDRVLKGEGIVITLHGTPVVELRAVQPAPQAFTEADLAWLASRRVPAQQNFETPSQSLAALRDEEAV